MKALEKIIEAKENINMGYNEWAINCLDEAISEIEALQQPKSCDNCRSESCSVKRILLELGEINSSYFYCNDYEPKEQ